LQYKIIRKKNVIEENKVQKKTEKKYRCCYLSLRYEESFWTDYEGNDCYDVTVMTLSGDDVTSPLTFDRLIVADDDGDGMFWFLVDVV